MKILFQALLYRPFGVIRDHMILIRFKLNYMSKHFADYKWFCRFDDDVFVKVNVFFDLV